MADHTAAEQPHEEHGDHQEMLASSKPSMAIAMAPRETASSGRYGNREYHPRPSKQRMKLNRYRLRGAIQSSGNGRYVLRNVVGNGQQQGRGAGRQKQPEDVLAQCGRGDRIGRGNLFDGCRRLRRRSGAVRRERAQPEEGAVSGRPHPGLAMRAEDRLEQERVLSSANILPTFERAYRR